MNCVEISIHSRITLYLVCVFIGLFVTACSQAPQYDLVIRNGTIYDGSGSPGVVGDVAINGDTIAAVGNLGTATGKTDIDATGLAVSPGFINMMCWANVSLIHDGRSQSDIRQGVTLEILGEGGSMGPLNQAMKDQMVRHQGDIKYDIEWTTLDEYLVFLEERGVSPNIASFVGAENPREYVIGHEDRPATSEELDEMRALVRTAMEDGALGVASALIYPPGSFADTDELIALAEVSAEYDGIYISHIRDEGAHMIGAINELIEIARSADIRAEIYHLKAAGRANWDLFPEAVALIEEARAEGLQITADIYPYPASSTGLNATMPPWVQEGGFDASLRRMADPETRKRIIREMNDPSVAWENMFHGAGSPDNILLVSFKNEALKPLTGKSLGEIAEMRGTTPENTIMDLIIEDESRIGTVYFSQSEDVVRRAFKLPWVSFCSDAASLAPEGVFLKSNPHPRAYGAFARVLGKYTRDEQLVPLEEAIRKLTSLPADNLKIDRRGRLVAGHFADVVVFDPDTIQDHATFVEPHQYATGVHHVFVNGTPVLRDGEHTGAKPGRVVRGPGWTKHQ